jgi:hypothetical protein
LDFFQHELALYIPIPVGLSSLIPLGPASKSLSLSLSPLLFFNFGLTDVPPTNKWSTPYFSLQNSKSLVTSIASLLITLLITKLNQAQRAASKMDSKEIRKMNGGASIDLASYPRWTASTGTQRRGSQSGSAKVCCRGPW